MITCARAADRGTALLPTRRTVFNEDELFSEVNVELRHVCHRVPKRNRPLAWRAPRSHAGRQGAAFAGQGDAVDMQEGRPAVAPDGAESIDELPPCIPHWIRQVSRTRSGSMRRSLHRSHRAGWARWLLMKAATRPAISTDRRSVPCVRACALRASAEVKTSRNNQRRGHFRASKCVHCQPAHHP